MGPGRLPYPGVHHGILLVSLLLVAILSCNRQPRPRYTPEGLLVDLPEGAWHADLLGLAGDPIVEQGPLLVERLQLPYPVDVQLANGEVTTREAAWRISVSSMPGSYHAGALFWVIWLGETPLVAHESPDMSRISAVTFDSGLVTQGGQVSVSYGLQSDGREPVALLPPTQ